jgi:NAD(P)H-dependent FMN reductase
MKIAIVSSSLNKKSQSLILGEYAKEYLIKNYNIEVTLIDMKEYPLPLCCSEVALDESNVLKLKKLLSSADSIIFSTPIYNYVVSSVLTNLLDLTGDAWKEKLIGMMCTAGGSNGYMAVMTFANSLMLNFKCIIVPRFVYASQNAFNTDKREIKDSKIKKRVEELSDKMVALTQALAKSI